MPIVAGHDVVAALALPLVVLVLLVLLLLLLLLQPAAASAITAAAARTRRPFIWIRLHFRISHYVGFPIERTAFRLMACRQIGRLPVKRLRGSRRRLSSASACVKGSSIRPPQWADFVPLIKSPPFTPRQEGYPGLGWQL
jgi:hypothetical protein